MVPTFTVSGPFPLAAASAIKCLATSFSSRTTFTRVRIVGGPFADGGDAL